MATLQDYKQFLSIVRRQTGVDAISPDDSGLASFRVQDEYNANLQFVEETGTILCFVEVARLPKDAGREVYRDLLAGALFGKDTAGGFFALEPATETVVYNYFFGFDRAAADPEEFVETLEKVLQVCDIWADRIRGDLAAGDGELPAAAAPEPSGFPGGSFRLDP